MGPLGPFWPQSNEAKRGQGGQPPTLNSRWAHLIQVWPQSCQSHKWPKGPQEANWPVSSPGLWQSPEATRSSSASFPFHQCTPHHGLRNGAYMV
ncbi:hypothetical protein O181_108967 [Austropuccinia psidii MF-1]|uniref:Uncharacterized protein n=1 Tax=Austropuccinia psidii MF-1 TaxID=1389203 RepID=A0A9Q3JWY0_9BASI|nr:hypothetical protein [Austropuccinia psidii MF-1]